MKFRLPITGYRFLITAVLCLCAFAPSFSLAQLDVAVIDLMTDVDAIRYARDAKDFSRLDPIRFHRWDSIRFDNQAYHSAENFPVQLTNSGVFVRWEAYKTPGESNAWILKTGTVVSATSGWTRVWLTPDEAGLPTGAYYSVLRAICSENGTNRQIGVLAYNRLEVLWSPDPDHYSYSGPYPEVVWHSGTGAIWAAISAGDAALGARVSGMEGRTSFWNSAYGWGNHSGLYPLLATYSAATQSLWAAISATAPGGYGTVSNWAATAYGWGNHVGLYPLLATYAWATQSLWAANATKADLTGANLTNLVLSTNFFTISGAAGLYTNMNGYYSYTGIVAGKPSFVGPHCHIHWTSYGWEVINIPGPNIPITNDTYYPWDATGWYGGAVLTQGNQGTADGSFRTNLNVYSKGEIETRFIGEAKILAGDLSNSYVMVTGTDADGTYRFYAMNGGHPYYNSAGRPVFSSGRWNLFSTGITYTNASVSYLPPYDGWFNNGTQAAVKVEFFSGREGGGSLPTNSLVYIEDMVNQFYYNNWFSWEIVSIEDGVPDVVSVVTNMDMLLRKESYVSGNGCFGLSIYNERNQGFVDFQVSSSVPSVATVTNFFIQYVSSGTTTVTATLGDFGRSTNLVMGTIGASDSYFPIAILTNSLSWIVTHEIDSRLTDGSNKAVYSTQNHATTNYVRNTNCWAAGLDLTAISPWSSWAGPYYEGTLIGEDCVLYSSHAVMWHPTLPIGGTIRFITASNTVVERTLIARRELQNDDFTVCKLNAPISTNEIRPALLAADNLRLYAPSSEYANNGRMFGFGAYNNLRALFWFDQFENAYVMENPDAVTICSLNGSTNSVRKLYNKFPVIGDSSSGMYWPSKTSTRIILIGKMFSTRGGPSISKYNADLRAAAAALGCDTDSIVDANFAAMGCTDFVTPPGPKN